MADENEKDEKDTGATSDELGEAGKKALKAERDARRQAEKELAEIRTQLKSIEDEGKSELDKLRDQVATLTKEAEAATAKADRIEVAVAAGLTPAQARRLVGATREELEADAAAMAEELGLKKDEAKNEDEKPKDEELPQDERPLGRPKENLRSGASVEDEETPDAAKLADSILKKAW